MAVSTVCRGTVRSTNRSQRHPTSELANESTPSLRPSVVVETLIVAVWIGLAAGLGELGLLLARMRFVSSATPGMLQLNRHFAWIIPVANTLLFLGAGLVLAAMSLIAPRLIRRLAIPLFVSLALTGWLWTFHQLHPLAAVALATGLSMRVVMPLLNRTRGGPRSIMRWTMPILVLVVALIFGFEYPRIAFAERLAFAGSGSARAPKNAKNVLLVVLDTVRADRMSLHGYHRDTTPFLNRFASQRGVTFDFARAPAPWTLPSHASLFTGLWPHVVDVGRGRPLDDRFLTIAEFVAGRGYRTAAFVANTFNCNSWYGLGQGFHRYEDYPDRDQISVTELLRNTELGQRLLTAIGGAANVRAGIAGERKTAERINRDVLGWLDGYTDDRPFFVFLNYSDAHDPYVLPAGETPQFGSSALTDADRRLLHTWHLEVRKGALPEHTTQMIGDGYDDCLAYLDRKLGELFGDLEHRGILKDTWVIITSDHGEQFGEHGLYLHSNSLYRAVIDVPLIIVPPGGAATPLRIPDPVSLRDLPATIVERLELLYESPPFPGASLARFWDQSVGFPQPDPVLSELSRRSEQGALKRQGSHASGGTRALAEIGQTYIRSGNGNEELYDIRTDPGETRNMVGEPESAEPVQRNRSALNRIR